MRAIRVASSRAVLACTAVLAVCALAGCQAAGAGAKPAPTQMPTAEQILARARQVDVRDIADDFTISGTSSGRPVSVTGTEQVTRDPFRAAATFSMTTGNSTMAGDEVLDGATHTAYVKVREPSYLASDKWRKTADPVGLTSFDRVLAFEQLAGATLVGPERAAGADVWHLRGTVAEVSTFGGSSAGNAADVYLRRDMYAPVEVVLHGPASGDHLDITYVYTAINTGITIDLPPPEQVESA